MVNIQIYVHIYIYYIYMCIHTYIHIYIYNIYAKTCGPLLPTMGRWIHRRSRSRICWSHLQTFEIRWCGHRPEGTWRATGTGDGGTGRMWMVFLWTRWPIFIIFRPGNFVKIEKTRGKICSWYTVADVSKLPEIPKIRSPFMILDCTGNSSNNENSTLPSGWSLDLCL